MWNELTVEKLKLWTNEIGAANPERTNPKIVIIAATKAITKLRLVKTKKNIPNEADTKNEITKVYSNSGTFMYLNTSR